MDKRRAKRITYPCDVELYGMGSGNIDAQIRVISLKGAFIEAPKRLEVGTRLTLRFVLPAGPLVLAAEVAHVNEAGIGVHFLALNREQHTALESLLAQHR
jgi:hypothetical protein